MTNDTQTAIEALDFLVNQYCLSDCQTCIDTEKAHETIRAAIQSKPVDVEWDLNERELILNKIEKDYHEIDGLLFDEMPAAEEAQDFFLTHDLQAIIDELKSWRKQHWSEGFRPDYCAAKEALKEHLNTPLQSPVTKEEAREAFDDFDNQIAQQNTELWNDTIETIRKCLQAAG